MSEGVWTIGLIDAGAGDSAMVPYPPKDNFRRYTMPAPAGTAPVVVASSAARLYMGVFANASATTPYYVQFFQVLAPANNAQPIWQVRLPPATSTGGVAEISLASVNGLPTQLALTLALSTTPNVLTLATANDLAFASVIYTARR